MKHLPPLLAAAALMTSSAFADIRRHHGGFTIGIGDHHGHHRHHGFHGHDRHHRGFGYHGYQHGYLGLGHHYSPLFHPAYFASNYSSPAYYDDRTVVVTERTPEPVRASSYAPTWSPGGGWKTHPWYRSRPTAVTTPDTLRDARSSAQLQQIYGEQATALAR